MGRPIGLYMTRAAENKIPDGYIVARQYSPPDRAIPFLQFFIFAVSAFPASQIFTNSPNQPLFFILIVGVLVGVFLVHEIVHWVTEILLGYQSRVSLLPPRHLGPKCPVPRKHMLIVLAAPLVVISFLLVILMFHTAVSFFPIIILIFNAMLSAADIWAFGVLSRMPSASMVLMELSDTGSEQFTTWLLVPGDREE